MREKIKCDNDISAVNRMRCIADSSMCHMMEFFPQNTEGPKEKGWARSRLEDKLVNRRKIGVIARRRCLKTVCTGGGARSCAIKDSNVRQIAVLLKGG